MAITPENIAELKEHIRDLKVAAVKIRKYQLEEGQTVDDLDLSLKDLIETSLEVRILDVDKQISDKVIDKDQFYALRTYTELLKAYRNEKTTVVRGSDDKDKKEVEENVMTRLRKSLVIQELD